MSIYFTRFATHIIKNTNGIPKHIINIEVNIQSSNICGRNCKWPCEPAAQNIKANSPQNNNNIDDAIFIFKDYLIF
jgi:hypothetical protein